MAASETSVATSACIDPKNNDASSANIKPLHLIFLVHGYAGTPKELEYFEQSLVRETVKHPSSRFLVHSCTTNKGRTNDGIVAGGTRLATEVLEFIQSLKEEHHTITISFVGNSLGGLYARYAISKLPWSETVQPMVFCTVATPHMGSLDHTYVPLPRCGPWVVACALRQTGKDLFRYTTIIDDLTLEPIYRKPLQQFKKRIAYANAFGTDFQVPTVTAAFLSPDSKSLNHFTVESPKGASIVLAVETHHDANFQSNTKHMAESLDAMGWTKVFCDNRDNIRIPAVPLPFSSNHPPIPDKEKWSSCELIPLVSRHGNRWHFPMGHSVLVANSKSHRHARRTKRGQPLVNRMAATLIHDILSYEL